MNPQDFGIFLIKRSGFFQDFQISGFFDPSQNEKFQSRILWIEIFDPEKTYLKANSVFDHFATKIIQKKKDPFSEKVSLRFSILIDNHKIKKNNV